MDVQRTSNEPSIDNLLGALVTHAMPIRFTRPATVRYWLCVRVPDLYLGGCRFESRPGLLHTKVYSAFHPSGVGKS